MKKQEATATPKVAKWFLKQIEKSVPFEIKHTRGYNTFNFNEIANHQLVYLEAATTKKGFYWKIEDEPGKFRPFDCISYKNTDAYILIVFPKIVCAIEIREILKIKNKHKSISSKEAEEIADYKINVSEL